MLQKKFRDTGVNNAQWGTLWVKTTHRVVSLYILFVKIFSYMQANSESIYKKSINNVHPCGWPWELLGVEMHWFSIDVFSAVQMVLNHFPVLLIIMKIKWQKTEKIPVWQMEVRCQELAFLAHVKVIKLSILGGERLWREVGSLF